MTVYSHSRFTSDGQTTRPAVIDELSRRARPSIMHRRSRWSLPIRSHELTFWQFSVSVLIDVATVFAEQTNWNYQLYARNVNVKRSHFFAAELIFGVHLRIWFFFFPLLRPFSENHACVSKLCRKLHEWQGKREVTTHAFFSLFFFETNVGEKQVLRWLFPMIVPSYFSEIEDVVFVKS